MKPSHCGEAKSGTDRFQRGGISRAAFVLSALLVFVIGVAVGCNIYRLVDWEAGARRSLLSRSFMRTKGPSNDLSEGATSQEDAVSLLWWENFDTANTLHITPCAINVATVLQTIASSFELAARERVNIKFIETGLWFDAAAWSVLFSEPAISVGTAVSDEDTEPSNMLSCNDPIYTQGMWNSNRNSALMEGGWGFGEQNCAYHCPQSGLPTQQGALWLFKALRPSEFMDSVIKNYKNSHDWHSYFMIGVYVGAAETTQDSQDQQDWTHNWKHSVKRMKAVEKILAPRSSKPIRFFLVADDMAVSNLIAKSFNKDHVFTRLRLSGVEHDDVSAATTVADLYLLAACDELIATEPNAFTDTVHALRQFPLRS